MTARIRAATEADAEPCGRIIFEAFKGIAEQHAFPLDFPSPEVATQLAQSFMADPWIFGVVAEREGRVVGSNFLAEADPIRGVGRATHGSRPRPGAGRCWRPAGPRCVQHTFGGALRLTRVRCERTSITDARHPSQQAKFGL